MGIYVLAYGKNREVKNHEKGYKMQITIGTFNLNNLLKKILIIYIPTRSLWRVMIQD
jgi:hypothetical protein